LKFRALIYGVRLTINGRVKDYESGDTFELDPKVDAFRIEQLTGTKPPMIEEVRTPKPMTKKQMAAAKKTEEEAAAKVDGKPKSGILAKAASAVSSIMGGGGNPDADAKVRIDIYPDAKNDGKFVLVLDEGVEGTEENPNPKIFEDLSEGDTDTLVKDSGLLEDKKDNVLKHDAPYDFPDPNATPE